MAIWTKQATATTEQASTPTSINEETSNELVLKTEFVRNLVVKKLNEVIIEVKKELAMQDPHFADMQVYIDAMKDDTVALAKFKNQYKMK